MATRRILINGTVQGVGFRWFVSRQAEAFGITGEAWNRRDGWVEVIAHHLDPTRLEAFKASLYLGPGVVEEIEACDVPDCAFDGFRITSAK